MGAVKTIVFGVFCSSLKKISGEKDDEQQELTIRLMSRVFHSPHTTVPSFINLQQFVLLLKALTQDRGLHQLEVHFWEEVDSLNKDAGSLTEEIWSRNKGVDLSFLV